VTKDAITRRKSSCVISPFASGCAAEIVIRKTY
jgi:hypothetical protein